MGRGNPEQGQNLVTHKLIDDGPVALHDLYCPILQAARYSLHVLWIELLRHRGEARQIGEEDCGLAAFAFGSARGCRWDVSGRYRLGEVMAAGVAENRLRRKFIITGWTGLSEGILTLEAETRT